jgi:P27 family predicted phage terminase small subunit
MRLLTRADRDALTVYCQTYARWMAAEIFLQQHGEVYPLRDEKGNVRCMQQFPQVNIARSLLQVVQSYQQEFGMTPSARTRVHEIPGLLQDDDDELFLKRPHSTPPPSTRSA